MFDKIIPALMNLVGVTGLIASLVMVMSYDVPWDSDYDPVCVSLGPDDNTCLETEEYVLSVWTLVAVTGHALSVIVYMCSCGTPTADKNRPTVIYPVDSRKIQIGYLFLWIAIQMTRILQHILLLEGHWFASKRWSGLLVPFHFFMTVLVLIPISTMQYLDTNKNMFYPFEVNESTTAGVILCYVMPVILLVSMSGSTVVVFLAASPYQIVGLRALYFVFIGPWFISIIYATFTFMAIRKQQESSKCVSKTSINLLVGRGAFPSFFIMLLYVFCLFDIAKTTALIVIGLVDLSVLTTSTWYPMCKFQNGKTVKTRPTRTVFNSKVSHSRTKSTGSSASSNLDANSGHHYQDQDPLLGPGRMWDR